LASLPVEEVRELFVVLAKALRAHQLYDENNPVYQRFVSQLADALRSLWLSMDRLQVSVEEDRFFWMGESVYESSSRTDSLSFLLFKDGIREFTLFKGVEEHELADLLKVLNRARDLRPEGDDLLTVLWEADLHYFTYSYVDFLADGVILPEAGEGFDGGFDGILEEEMKGLEVGEEEEGVEAGSGQVSADDFNPTLYSLDPLDMEKIQEEVRAEMERDLRGDVLAALFDRVEEPRFPKRQKEILEIFEYLLPNLLGRGALAAAGSILEELARLLASKDALRPEGRAEAERILNQVSGADTLRELIQALEDGTITPDPAELSALLRHLRSGALEPLLRGAEEAKDQQIKAIVQDAVKAIAQKHTTGLLRSLRSDDPVVVAGACRLAGKMQLSEAGSHIVDLFSHESEEVRKAAVEAALDLRSSTVVGALQEAIGDSDREVRVAAVRALGALRYAPATAAIRRVIEGRQIRHADISEQIAFFESYGALGDPDGVRLLDGYLNGRGLLGRKESGEIRACAALALGRMRTPEARDALERAQREQDPVVRSAVNRALRVEG
jgi:HEAT repeat protein